MCREAKREKWVKRRDHKRQKGDHSRNVATVVKARKMIYEGMMKLLR